MGFVGVVGIDCVKVEDVIGELVVGDGSDPSRFIFTPSHARESLEQAVEFARSLTATNAGEVEVVEL